MDQIRPYVVHSPDDGGYYVEMIDHNGRTVEVWPGGRRVYKQRATASRKGWERQRALSKGAP